MKRKEKLPFTKEELKPNQDVEVWHIFRKISLKKFAKYKNYGKLWDNCHYTHKYRDSAHSICNLKFNVHNEIPVVFQNGSDYDYHFIIIELANEFEEQFECLGENKESTKLFLL